MLFADIDLFCCFSPTVFGCFGYTDWFVLFVFGKHEITMKHSQISIEFYISLIFYIYLSFSLYVFFGKWYILMRVILFLAFFIT